MKRKLTTTQALLLLAAAMLIPTILAAVVIRYITDAGTVFCLIVGSMSVAALAGFWELYTDLAKSVQKWRKRRTQRRNDAARSD